MLKNDQENVIDKVKNTHYNVFKFFNKIAVDREEYMVFGSKERRWMVRISVTGPWK